MTLSSLAIIPACALDTPFGIVGDVTLTPGVPPNFHVMEIQVVAGSVRKAVAPGDLPTVRERALLVAHSFFFITTARGVPISRLLSMCGASSADFPYTKIYCADGYRLCFRTEDLVKRGAMVAVEMDGKEMEPRLVVAGLWGWAWAKWVARIEFSKEPLGTRFNSSEARCRRGDEPFIGAFLRRGGLFGIAFYPWERVVEVEVSEDGVKWERAEILNKEGWWGEGTAFKVPWIPKKLVIVRAKTESGKTFGRVFQVPVLPRPFTPLGESGSSSTSSRSGVMPL